MKTSLTASALKLSFLVSCLSVSVSLAQAQVPSPRITSPIDSSQRIMLPGTHSPMATPGNNVGRVPQTSSVRGMNIVFARSAAQEASLAALIAAQQNPKSPLYHHWLTPDQFAARFGVADADLAKVQAWLKGQGFALNGVSRSRDRISFSGTVAQVETAFGTQLRYYAVNGKSHYAPSSDLNVPAALAPVVQAVRNLSSFRPKSHLRIKQPAPRFTSSQSGSHFLTPKDVSTIYDVTPAYNAGYDGAGQSIAVVGQSLVVVSDMENFESAAGLAKKDPTLVLVPNSGTATVYTGDESESDLDLEYSGGMAPGASISFIYVGNSANYSVLDALTYAIDNRVAPIISISYGLCETQLASSDYTSLNGILAQAASQGQTVVSASGDSGSEDCSGVTGLTTSQQQALAVDFPASSQYVTGMGGSEFPTSDVSSSNTTYWQSASGTDVVSSALSYIPEQAWNDDSSTSGISSGGGGVSTFTARPTWQTGVPGIPSGSFRLVPDISLSASPNNAGFLYCSSDSSIGVTGSCSNGFRDSTSTYLTVAGGTSFDAPIYAGLQALINQKVNSSGEGVVNPTLYSLAADSNAYASAFHDVTSGSNACTAGTTYCSTAGSANYSAAAGYDRATGLGSIDFYNLLSSWPSMTGSFTLAGTDVSVAAGGSGSSTVTITPSSGYTGIVAFSVTSSPSLTNGCLSIGNTTVSGTSAVTATLNVHTSSSACGSAAAAAGLPTDDSLGGLGRGPLSHLGLGLMGMVFAGFLGFGPRKLRKSAGLLVLAIVAMTGVGCGGGGTTATVSSLKAAKGTYTLTIVGTDTTTSSITGTTTATLTVD
jgi:subtilase family serine protease